MEELEVVDDLVLVAHVRRVVGTLDVARDLRADRLDDPEEAPRDHQHGHDRDQRLDPRPSSSRARRRRRRRRAATAITAASTHATTGATKPPQNWTLRCSTAYARREPSRAGPVCARLEPLGDRARQPGPDLLGALVPPGVERHADDVAVRGALELAPAAPAVAGPGRAAATAMSASGQRAALEPRELGLDPPRAPPTASVPRLLGARRISASCTKAANEDLPQPHGAWTPTVSGRVCWSSSRRARPVASGATPRRSTSAGWSPLSAASTKVKTSSWSTSPGGSVDSSCPMPLHAVRGASETTTVTLLRQPVQERHRRGPLALCRPDRPRSRRTAAAAGAAAGPRGRTSRRAAPRAICELSARTSGERRSEPYQCSETANRAQADSGPGLGQQIAAPLRVRLRAQSQHVDRERGEQVAEHRTAAQAVARRQHRRHDLVRGVAERLQTLQALGARQTRFASL